MFALVNVALEVDHPHMQGVFQDACECGAAERLPVTRDEPLRSEFAQDLSQGRALPCRKAERFGDQRPDHRVNLDMRLIADANIAVARGGAAGDESEPDRLSPIPSERSRWSSGARVCSLVLLCSGADWWFWSALSRWRGQLRAEIEAALGVGQSPHYPIQVLCRPPKSS